jgi:hypothetical protein
MFILGPERDADVVAAFKRYNAYLREHTARFPPSAHALALSDWYYGFSDHKAPHDAWLETTTISEVSSSAEGSKGMRETSLTIRLLGAYQDGHIEFHYPKVFAYQLNAENLRQGHGDWRYDEFRLDDQGRLVHEIEWAAFGASSNWVIVASDVEHRWQPSK